MIVEVALYSCVHGVGAIITEDSVSVCIAQGRNVVLESKYGSPKIVNDGVTIAREVELEDPVENIGAKLVRQAAAKTNDTAGDGTTTATILSAAFINEGVKIVSAGTNPVQLIRGIEKTTNALVQELKALSTPLGTDQDLANVAAVSAGGNPEIGKLIADAMAKVGRQGVVTMEESKTAEDNLFFVEGMQFDRGYYSPYFVTDPERMVSSSTGSSSSIRSVGLQQCSTPCSVQPMPLPAVLQDGAMLCAQLVPAPLLTPAPPPVACRSPSTTTAACCWLTRRSALPATS